MTARALLLAASFLAACADPASPQAGAPAPTTTASAAEHPDPAAPLADEVKTPNTATVLEAATATTVGTEPASPTESDMRTASPAPLVDGRYAVLIGIDDYPGSASDLPSGAHDLRAMQALLIGRFGYRPEQVLVLQDQRATRGAVRRAIRDHLGRAAASALLYVSGHGIRLHHNLGRADAEQDGRDEALYVWADDGRHSALIADDEVGAWMGELRARHVVVVLDACHSGTGARGAALPIKEVVADDVEALLDPGAPWNQPAPNPRRGVVTLAASRDQEVAFSGLDGDPSLFTAALTDVLAHTDPDTSLATAMRDVSDRVRAVSRSYGSEHRPQFGGDAGLTLQDVFLHSR